MCFRTYAIPSELQNFVEDNVFPAAGTQVKWNRIDGNILASSHSNQVLIWDRRVRWSLSLPVSQWLIFCEQKGSLPLRCIPAHGAKIYGIDWAHDRRNELVTCSLDKTVKIWDVQSGSEQIVIKTGYPVWRARDLPFGQGILSLPQRGESTLEMYVHEDPYQPLHTFDGHKDVVKEFVWRRGGESTFRCTHDAPVC